MAKNITIIALLLIFFIGIPYLGYTLEWYDFKNMISIIVSGVIGSIAGSFTYEKFRKK